VISSVGKKHKNIFAQGRKIGKKIVQGKKFKKLFVHGRKKNIHHKGGGGGGGKKKIHKKLKFSPPPLPFRRNLVLIAPRVSLVLP